MCIYRLYVYIDTAVYIEDTTLGNLRSETHLSSYNLNGHFSTERGKRDLET